MIFAVFDVLLAVNMCINYSFFTFITYTICYVRLYDVIIYDTIQSIDTLVLGGWVVSFGTV